MHIRKVNLAEAFGSFDERWSPRIAGQVNDTHLKLAKLDGEFIWHKHEREDEAFIVVRGSLTMHLRDDLGERTIELREGEMLIMPRGIEHKPEARDGECWVLLVEPATTLNTGNVENERTVKALKSIA
jgi:mannose-6-phosphate isomerase-like protein (cupin superfamily)